MSIHQNVQNVFFTPIEIMGVLPICHKKIPHGLFTRKEIEIFQLLAFRAAIYDIFSRLRAEDVW
jgi:hypothetical protein